MMSNKKIDGKQISDFLRIKLKEEIAELPFKPALSVILVGDNEASCIYVRNKEKACHQLGIHCEIHRFSSDISERELLDFIQQLNNTPQVHGILVQLPLPIHIREQCVIEMIDPNKDIDGFHPSNLGQLLLGHPRFIPCTPLAIMTLLEEINFNFEGHHAVVIGRSNIVGKPISILLQQKNMTVTMCHSKTKNLSFHCQQADLIVAAIGKAQFVDHKFLKKDAVIIDVGINRLANGKIVGDVDYQDCIDLCDRITPVPKGVGPMTITMLLKNTLHAAKKQWKGEDNGPA